MSEAGAGVGAEAKGVDVAPRRAGVDVLEALLDGPRAREAFLLRMVLDPPWSLRVKDEAALTVLAALRGDLWIRHDDAEPVPVRAGQVAVVIGPDHYTLGDDPSRTPSLHVGPDGRCAGPSEDGDRSDGAVTRGTCEQVVRTAPVLAHGVRSWGGGGPDAAVHLVGTYAEQGEAGRPLLTSLPRVVVEGGVPAGLLDLLAAEMAHEAPGNRAVVDRLLDVVLVTTLRAWFERQHEVGPGWYRARLDPEVSRALALLHREVAHPWTVADLSREVGLSRPALARRFAELVGEPPMTYLASWRLALAADLLIASDATLASIAREVGYGTAFSLSAAFKRAYGVSPQAYREGRRPTA